MRVNSSTRVTAFVTLALLLTVLSSLGALLTARDLEEQLGAVATRTLPSVEAAAGVQQALLQQRGLVAAYLLDDGRGAWLHDLERIPPALDRSLAEAMRTARTEEEQRILGQLAGACQAYERACERSIALARDGRAAEARSLLLGDVSRLADQATGLCRQLVLASERSMRLSLSDEHRRVNRLALALAAGVAVAILLSFGLLLIVFRRLLLPVRRLTRDAKALVADPARAPGAVFTDDVHELEYYSRALMSDVTRTRTDLQESRHRLLNAEKLAAVGKFAACAAHEIRSPLTSMKMWLYQIRQSAAGDPETRHSCDVLDEEIARLEELATSFLRFSRPPRLHLARLDIGEVIDGTLSLTRHRLEEKGLQLVRVNGTPMPPVLADAQQLRQVLLNLILNAVDAAPDGGTVRISQSLEPHGKGHWDVVVRVQDNGPGIPESLRARLFEPFVTGKPNGTGLGLAVASSIVTQHGGRLLLESGEGPGAVFAVHIAACETHD